MNNYYGIPYPVYSYPALPVYTYPNMAYPTYHSEDKNEYRHGSAEIPLVDMRISDHGKNPFVVNIAQASRTNTNYRTTIWTGKHLQVTLMDINVGDDIGLEIHHNNDQFLRVEDGIGLVQMGKEKNKLTFKKHVGKGSAIMIPAGTWHNLKNIGDTSLKLYSIYAPPEHPYGTVHRTKADAIAAEGSHGHHHKK